MLSLIQSLMKKGRSHLLYSYYMTTVVSNIYTSPHWSSQSCSDTVYAVYKWAIWGFGNCLRLPISRPFEISYSPWFHLESLSRSCACGERTLSHFVTSHDRPLAAYGLQTVHGVKHSNWHFIFWPIESWNYTGANIIKSLFGYSSRYIISLNLN